MQIDEKIFLDFFCYRLIQCFSEMTGTLILATRVKPKVRYAILSASTCIDKTCTNIGDGPPAPALMPLGQAQSGTSKATAQAGQTFSRDPSGNKIFRTLFLRWRILAYSIFSSDGGPLFKRRGIRRKLPPPLLFRRAWAQGKTPKCAPAQYVQVLTWSTVHHASVTTQL